MVAQNRMWDGSMIWETSRLIIKERKLVENRFKGRGNFVVGKGGPACFNFKQFCNMEEGGLRYS